MNWIHLHSKHGENGRRNCSVEQCWRQGWEDRNRKNSRDEKRKKGYGKKGSSNDEEPDVTKEVAEYPQNIESQLENLEIQDDVNKAEGREEIILSVDKAEEIAEKLTLDEVAADNEKEKIDSIEAENVKEPVTQSENA